MALETVGTPALWMGFTGFVVCMLAIDLGVFHRRAHEVRIREALAWSCVWFALAMVFNAGIWVWFGSEKGLEFLTGYLIEKALSVDNLFVFLVIFSYFAVPPMLQHRVLYWGILGALIMRAIFIVIGAALLQTFHWVIYILGGFLVLTGAKMALQRGEQVHPERNPVLRVYRRLVRSVPEYRGPSFFVRESGKLCATPLLLVLVTIEASDLIFAVDSIPAIFAITTDPFIVYTSNIFAILGLRALYFALAGMMTKFRHLKVGLAFVLVFVGAKMLLADVYKIPIVISLSVVAGLLGGAVVVSLWGPPPESPGPEEPPGPAGGEGVS